MKEDVKFMHLDLGFVDYFRLEDSMRIIILSIFYKYMSANIQIKQK